MGDARVASKLPAGDADVLAVIRTAFPMFAAANGTLPVKMLSSFFRTLGQVPTDAEIADALTDQGIAAAEGVTLPQLEAIVLQKYHDSASFDLELRSAFDGFDNDGDGLIGEEDVRYFFTSVMGVPMTDSDIFAMLLFARPGEHLAGFSYANFCAMVRGRLPAPSTSVAPPTPTKGKRV